MGGFGLSSTPGRWIGKDEPATITFGFPPLVGHNCLIIYITDMDLTDIAENIDSAKMGDIRRLASSMDIKGAKIMGRKQLIDKIKRKVEYREIVTKEEGKSEFRIICPNCKSERKLEQEVSSNTCYNCGEEMISVDDFESTKKVESSNGYSKERPKGYVYVLVSSSKPDLIKIGMTNREPEERAKELNSSTGVAMPYIVAYEAETPHPEKVERKVHNRLSDKRVNQNREFFRVKLKRAIEVIEQVV